MIRRFRLATEPGDLGWVVMAHGEVYADQFGWDTDFEALVARIVADHAAGHDPAREAAWVAEVDGRRVGCVFCVADPDDPDIARLRILLVTPEGRGAGIGSGLVARCVDFAREAGYSTALAVDQRRAVVGPQDLRGRGLHAGRRGAAPQLRPRPGRPALVAGPPTEPAGQ